MVSATSAPVFAASEMALSETIAEETEAEGRWRHAAGDGAMSDEDWFDQYDGPKQVRFIESDEADWFEAWVGWNERTVGGEIRGRECRVRAESRSVAIRELRIAYLECRLAYYEAIERREP